MMGSFITRGAIMLLGYVYPAYECFKVVERNRPDFESLRFWCQYWIIIAVVTVFERVGDVFVSWVPMYSEAKLAFIIYLWYPKTLGTNYVYATFVRPFVVRHEAEIDRQLNELTTRAGDLAFFWWQRGSVYIQGRFYELLAYVASQSNRTQQGSVPRQVPAVARQGPPPRPSNQVPPRGPPRDPQQGGTQNYPPPSSSTGGPAGYPPVNVDGPYPPSAAAAAPQPGPALYPPPPPPPPGGSVHRRRGSGPGTGPGSGSGNLSENSDSEYDVVDRQEGRPESNRTQQPNPAIGEQEVPPRVYNTRNRRPTGSRNLSEWLSSWVDSASSGKDE